MTGVIFVFCSCSCYTPGASSFHSQVIQVINFRDPTRFCCYYYCFGCFVCDVFLLILFNIILFFLIFFLNLSCVFFLVSTCQPCFSDLRSFVIPNFISFVIWTLHYFDLSFSVFEFLWFWEIFFSYFAIWRFSFR